MESNFPEHSISRDYPYVQVHRDLLAYFRQLSILVNVAIPPVLKHRVKIEWVHQINSLTAQRIHMIMANVQILQVEQMTVRR